MQTTYKIIKKKLKKKKAKTCKLAEILGISKQLLNYHLYNLKNGKNSFKLKQIKTICEYLEEDISIFF